MSSTYTNLVINTLAAHEDPVRAVSMKKYMKNKFEFYGISAPSLRELTRPFLQRGQLPKIGEVPDIVWSFWQQPQREFQFFAIELLKKYNKVAPPSWINLYEKLITEKSWWDTVDGLAAWHVGFHFKKYSDQVLPYTSKWMQSNNIWLQRTCLIFQLKYREETDFDLMKSCIIPLADSKEFFIRKAIGWALRQYSKFQPNEVMKFVQTQPLARLSYHEATRIILKK